LKEYNCGKCNKKCNDDHIVEPFFSKVILSANLKVVPLCEKCAKEWEEVFDSSVKNFLHYKDYGKIFDEIFTKFLRDEIKEVVLLT